MEYKTKEYYAIIKELQKNKNIRNIYSKKNIRTMQRKI